MTVELAYLSEVKTLLDKLNDDVGPLTLAAQWCAETVAGGGLVHVFGAGHSHMAAEEAFHRAGGLVPVNAVLVEWLMVHQGGRRASLLERQPGLGELIVSTEPVEEGDVFFVVSNSGRNPVPVEVAEAAKARGAKVIAITSRQHSEGVTRVVAAASSWRTWPTSSSIIMRRSVTRSWLSTTGFGSGAYRA